MPTRAVAYIRVSLKKMAEDGLSLDAQRARVQAHAKANGIELVDVIVDAASAKNLEREGLQRALAMLRAGDVTGLLVVKLDRLTRSLRDFEALLEDCFTSGAKLLSCSEQVDTTTAGGRMVLRILMAVAQHEREATGERTSATSRHQASIGGYTGGPAPYGYRVANPDAGDDESKMLEPEPAEQAVITVATGFKNQGLSLRSIARELDALGHRSRNGKPFAPGQLQRMLAVPEPTNP